MKLSRWLSGVLLLCVTWQASWADQPPHISYDRQTDEIALQVEDMPLSELLARIGVLAGLDVRLDPALEQSISHTLPAQPLQQALKDLAKSYRLNYIMQHGELRDGKRDLLAFYLLRDGHMSAADLVPLVSAQYEALVNMDRQSSNQQVSEERSWQRWRARFDRLPEQDRQYMEAQFHRKMQKRAEKAAKKARSREAREQRRAEKQAERDAREARLRERDPEAFQRREENREARRQRLMETGVLEPDR